MRLSRNPERARFVHYFVGAMSLLVAVTVGAQAIDEKPAEDAAGPVATYRDFTPGLTTIAKAREALGEPASEAKWYAWKLTWPSTSAGGFTDAFWVLGDPKEGRIGSIEASTIPEKYRNAAQLIEKLGEPEFQLTYPGGQRLLDYSRGGVRFTVDAEGKTIGAAYFPHGYPRVHEGARRKLDLSHLRQGPLATPKDPPDPRLSVGAAEISLIPENRSILPGDPKVIDPLRARCSVWIRGEERLALVGADLFGFMKSEIDTIAEELKSAGITHLVIGSSHDHSAPDTIGIYGLYPKRFVEHIQKRIVEGVREALASARKVHRVLVASEDLPLTGARVHGLFRNARNPGLLDPQMAIVQPRDAKDQPIVTLVHFACHVEGLEKGAEEISADFPGYLCDRLRERTGAPAVFLNGALGGMVSGDTLARTHEEAKRMGLRLAAEAERLIGFAVPSAGDAFHVERKRIEIPVNNPKFLLFEKLHRKRRAYYRGRIVSEMFHIRLGDAQLITVPGELLPEVSFEILRHMDGYPRMIVGLANDELGYLIPPEDFRTKAYEESMSPGPAAAPVVRDTALRMLEAR